MKEFLLALLETWEIVGMKGFAAADGRQEIRLVIQRAVTPETVEQLSLDGGR